MMTTRLVSSGDPEQRLLNYFHQLPETLKRYDTLKLDAFAFACTASSYLISEDVETASVKTLENQFNYPIVTSAAAIREALHYLGAKSIAIACPYPQWLLDRAYEYWKSAGFSISHKCSIQPESADTRSIYELRGAEATTAIANNFDQVDADVYLITGTGLPSLRTIIDLQKRFAKPVITTNLCLAWSCLRKAKVPFNEHAADADFPLLSGWQDELHNL